MPGFARADAESIADIEQFLCRATGEPVALGTVWIADGLLGRTVARVARARAITFGSLIFFAEGPDRPRAEPEVQTSLERFESLLVHECVHVWQYRREGWMFFLRQYLKSYFSGIWVRGSMSRLARHAAYVAIPLEQEAFLLELSWSEARSSGRRGSRRDG